ncbi:hypothetical protein [Pantoea vagans]|uniref:hypothetical protein n=1 Tax=Pantoea vagans TaxID=470934 RepID=UPI0023AFB57A|nr:hypothetical protein [Pantoea vagans]MDE8559332.1 hypothetical protein [Pantoea vagans]MDE8579332.1 hypothetical protein [Pantoea vagans]
MIIQKTAENFAGFMGGDFLFWLLVIIALTAFCCFIFEDSQKSGRKKVQRRSAAGRRR